VRDIGVNALLLEQEVVRLLEVLECESVLRELAKIHYELCGHVELHAAAKRLLVALENHVHQNPKLCGSLF